MNRIASFHLRAATIYALIGMAWGLQMAISEDHTLFPAHAHLNLLGWVSVFLYGLFFMHFPKAAEGWLAKAHLSIAHLGIVIMVPGIAIVHSGSEAGIPLAGGGAVLVALSMALFSIIVFRTTRKA